MELKEDFMTDSYLKNDAFSYMGLHKKAHREIDRLITSENSMDIISSVDHALNAAFSIFHLLEWKDHLEQSADTQNKKPKPGTCAKIAITSHYYYCMMWLHGIST
jgi:hypothetical protein